MAFSGTISETVFSTQKLIDTAFRRCRVPAQKITSEYIEIAQNALYLLLADLANSGAPLWCIERQLYPIYPGAKDITLDLGTVDVLNHNLRMLQEVTGTNTDTATTRTISFGSATEVTTVGILWAADAVPIAIEQSADGSTWETVQEETPVASAGQWTWFDLEQVNAWAYFRVRATSGTLDFSLVYTGNMPQSIPLARMNRDDYTNLSNSNFQSNRPLQFWFDRQVPRPIMHLWPVPNAAATVFQIELWRHRYIMDVGTLPQEIECPQRWYEAITSDLTRKLVYEVPDATTDAEYIGLLEKKADTALQRAQAEERDNSPIMWAPNLAPYTA